MLLLFLFLLPSIFWIVGLVDVVRRQFPDGSIIIVWVLVVVFLNFLGALISYFVGEKRDTLAAGTRLISTPAR